MANSRLRGFGKAMFYLDYQARDLRRIVIYLDRGECFGALPKRGHRRSSPKHSDAQLPQSARQRSRAAYFRRFAHFLLASRDFRATAERSAERKLHNNLQRDHRFPARGRAPGWIYRHLVDLKRWWNFNAYRVPASST